MAAKLSVLVPVRAADFSFYRKRLALRAALDLVDIETIVIDDGSPPNAAAEIARFCDQRCFKYLRLDTADKPFSLARSRNAGIREASSPAVYMDDADLVYRRDFFQAVAAQMALLPETPFNFLSIPAVYLTKNASVRIFEENCVDTSYTKIVNALLLESPKGSLTNNVVENYAPASGVIALSRELALRIEGYDERFAGWGGEDRDFIFRLLYDNSKIALPSNFKSTKTWNLNDTLAYEGWRALHRLHGEFMARHGLYALHLHHEKLAWRSPFASGRNMRMAAEKAIAAQLHDRVERDAFDLRQSVLFDIYRAHDVSGLAESTTMLAECLQKSNRLKDNEQGVSRPLSKKIRKFLVSPIAFFADSRFQILRAVARFFARR